MDGPTAESVAAQPELIAQAPRSRPAGRPHRQWLAACAVVLSLGLIGFEVAQYKIDLTRDIRFIGHADAAAYVQMARSLVEGRGLHVDYVSWHFIPYDPGITRREDHWPPFLAFAIAPFFLIYGQEPWVSRLAPIYIGSIGLPVLTALLAMAYSRRAYVGLAAGLLMLADLRMFTDSLRTLSDIAPAMLVAGFCWGLIAAARSPGRPWMHLVAGAFAAMAYYAKGSQLILLPLYPLLAMLIGGPAALRQKWTWAGMITAGLLVLPWMISNTIHYGRPLHSTQNFVSGYYGMESGDRDLWDRRTYYPYWGENLPRTSDRWRKFPTDDKTAFENWWEISWRNGLVLARWGLLGTRSHPRDWEYLGSPGLALRNWMDPPTERQRRRQDPAWDPSQWGDPWHTRAGIAAVGYLIALAAVAPLALLGWMAGPVIRRVGMRSFVSRLSICDFREPAPAIGNRRAAGATERLLTIENPADAGAPAAAPADRSDLWPPMLGATAALVLVLVVQWAFVAFLWSPQARFAFVMLPLVAVIGCTGASRLLELPLRLPPNRIVHMTNLIVTLTLCGVVLLAAHFSRQELHNWHVRGVGSAINHHPYRDNLQYVQMGEWIGQNLPDAVIMTRRPWQLLFYADRGNKGVTQPYGSPEQIFRIARYYGVTHYLDDAGRPGMGRFLTGRHPGMIPVETPFGTRLFELDYEHLPE